MSGARVRCLQSALGVDQEYTGGHDELSLAQAVADLGTIADACTELDGLAMPDALIHGDLHPGNVVLGPDGPMVIDWSDGAVGHSFIDLPTFLLRVDGRTRREGLIDAYLEGWAGIAPRSTLETAAELAMPVGAAYQVATYQVLLPAMDEPDRALFDNVDVSWARRTLDCLEHGRRRRHRLGLVAVALQQKTERHQDVGFIVRNQSAGVLRDGC